MMTQKPQREKDEMEGRESSANVSIGSQFSLLSVVTSNHPIDEADEIKEVKTLLNKGKKSLKNGDFAGALSFFNSGLEIEESNADLLAARCVTYMNISEVKMAEKDAHKLISLYPNNSQCLFLQSLVLKCQGQTEESLNVLVKSLAIANKLNQRLVEEIEEVTCQFLEILVSPINPFKSKMDLLEKTYQVGLLLFNYQKYILCIELMDSLLRFLEHYADIKAKTLYVIASALLGLGKRDSAQRLYEECQRLASETNNLKILTKTLVSLANVHLKNQNVYQSIYCFEKLVEIEKNLTEDGIVKDEQILHLWSADFRRYIRLNLRITYKTVGNLRRAYSYTKEYAYLVQEAESPQRIKSESFYLLGDVCESLGKYSLALRHYEEYLYQVETCGYKNLISKAYGCLGRINGKLSNWDAAFDCHSLHMKSASGIGSKEIIKAERFLADTYFLKKDFRSAICLYEKLCIKQIEQYQLCNIWLKLYQSYVQMEKSDIGLRYLENSLSQSRLYGYEEITILCEYHSANIYCSSNKEEKLQLAELYFKRMIHFLRGQIERHLQDCTQCPANYWSDLLQCYKGMQMIWVKRQQIDHCLQYAEVLQQMFSIHHRVGPEGSFLFSSSGQRNETLGLQDKCCSLEAIISVVNQQNATVCYYSLLKDYLLIWILQPGKGIVKRIVQEKSNPPIQQHIKQDLLNILQISDKTSPVLFCEGRSLPQRTEENAKNIIRKRESNQSNIGRNESPTEKTDNNCKVSNLTSLYNLLLSPVEHILCKLPDRSHLVIIASDVLQYCPFGALQDSHGIFLGERFSVTFVQSVLQLSQIITNAKRMDLSLKNHAELQCPNLEKSQPSANGVFLDSKLSFHSESFPDGKKVSNPKALKMMKAQHGNPSKINQGISNSSLSHRNSNVEYKNCFPMIRPPAPSNKTNENKESILLMTNPHLPEKSELYSQEWNSGVKSLQEAELEGCEIASSLGIFSISKKDATKKKFLELLPTASVVHIATWASCQEGLLAWSPSSVPVHPDSISLCDELSYIVTCQEISQLSLCAKLVVLSCGQESVWRGLDDIPLAHYLANAFLQAGAHSVLFCLKPIPDVVRRNFFKHFYDALQNGNWVSEALWKAQKHIASKDRFNDVGYWSPFVLFGNDCYLNLNHICQAMMHQLLNSAEDLFQSSSGKNLLTPGNIISEVPTMVENLDILQEILGKFLYKYSFREDLIQILLQLMINWPGRQCPPTIGQDLKPVELPPEIAKNDVCMSLLKFLGFNFVAKNVKQEGAYILYPYHVTGSLLQEVCLALSVIKDLSLNYDLIRAWCYILPLKQETISSLIDLMYITKLVWGLQFHLTDVVVQSLWCNPDTQRLLISMGYQQIGRFLNFHASPTNRKLLMASLQFLLSLSCHKDENLMNRFDAKQFGLSDKSHLQNIPKEESKVVSLNSLGIVHLPRRQFGFQTRWMQSVEKEEEMKEKMNLIQKHEQMKEFYREYTEKGKNMYQAMFATQAQKVLNDYGKKSLPKATKVKVFPGGTASRERIPCFWSPLPSLSQVERTRQQAFPAIKQWQKKMNDHYKNDLFHIYLPYAIKSSEHLGS